ncbi:MULTISPECIES: carbohydrate ABC transporter permease [Agathobacter]|uniref:Carbohydrate ABC transporter permease n=1 Tax=Agathobacter ruminis TaxID=1712665 RepID=A0A2G3DYX7_9FIRM|nr:MULTISPECIES: carbohydrate ABC transporter permease [Agathobacter]MBQ1682397.1 carbohydrate ABC transporter permease [Agathobacter sp.]MDC7302349.1 carbohydrate ABC transporter permease [Agathobacter ruminis]PHU36236.1 carbohydrate ABC transporter permease [Agathobacter ruminis]
MEDSSVKGVREKRFQVLINIILIILTLMAVLPFILLLASSLTEDGTLARFGYNFWPRKFSAYAYTYLFSSNAGRIMRSYGITIVVTVIGTAISLLIGPMLAYPLSRRDYKRAKIITFLVFFTMLFNGGIVPSYIMWTQTFHVKNTIWALIFPTLLFNGFFIILYKNNFATNIHPALIEAAKIDGAGEWYIYFKVILPLSLPILATIGLMVGLGYWNDWANGLYYITDEKLYSLQQLLKSIIDNIKNIQTISQAGAAAAKLPGTSIRMAMAVVGVIPVMILYPFFQKAFIAGISLGGVKE